jgi:hypothetical protein
MGAFLSDNLKLLLSFGNFLPRYNFLLEKFRDHYLIPKRELILGYLMLKSLFLISILTFQTTVLAQMVRASVFGSMKNINPAVVSTRPAGQFTLVGEQMEVEKTQELDSGTTGKADITATNMAVFRGGRGSGLTTEFSFLSSTGEMKRVNTKTDGSFINASAEASYTLANINVGMGNIGWGLMFTSFDLTTKGDLTRYNTTQNNTTIAGIFGLRGSILGLNGAFYVQGYKFSGEADFEEEDTGDPNAGSGDDEGGGPGLSIMLGGGLGFGSGASHFEVAIESPLQPMEQRADDGTMGESVRAYRISATAEFKLWGISLGYTGRLYMNGFPDPEQQFIRTLIFLGNEKSRLEHNVNFALGGDKGLSISGSFSMTEIDNKEPEIFTEPLAYPTKTKLMTISAKVGYAF